MIVFLDEDDRPGQGFGGRGRKVNKTAGYGMYQIKEIELVQMGKTQPKTFGQKGLPGYLCRPLKTARSSKG